MTNIDICVIGRKTPAFTEQLAIIRHIEGLKVLKRRNKPFYDITGEIKNDAAWRLMSMSLNNLLMNCDAELEIKDKQLRESVLKML